MHENVQRMSKIVEEVAEDICDRMYEATGDIFLQDKWQREDHIGNDGGGGTTRIVRQGKYLESGAVNTSTIYGEVNPEFAKKLKGDSPEVQATGVSLIFHPRNPNVPTIHMNFRYIRQGDKDWFGGGADLTPYLPNQECFSYFHSFWKNKLDAFDPSFYPKMKEECDQYFYIPHRKEMRGIGGIFYDYLEVNEDSWKMVESLARGFLDSYFSILKKTMELPFTEEDRSFQLYRRGRYVEFNLLYDRGTLFGLKTNGRIESILASLPPEVRYEYMYTPEAGSPYEEMNTYYQPHNWVQ